MLTFLLATAVTFSSLFNTSYVNPEHLPLVITPKKTSKVDFKTWAENNRDEVRRLLKKNGGILLRDWGLSTPEDFSTWVTAILGDKPIDYVAGEGSRKKVVNGVYTSTEAPPEFKIPLHNELSCTNEACKYISFFCEIELASGTGQTILGKTAEVTKEMQSDKELWGAFKGKIMRYVSRHPPEGSFYAKLNPTHKTWQEAFETTDKNEVNRICAEKGFECRWMNDWLEVTRKVSATHAPDHNFPHHYWFNQVHLYHPNHRKHGGWFNDLMVHLIYIVPDSAPYDIFYEDGSAVPEELVFRIYDALDRKTIYFDWHRGDLLILDNFIALHGRAPYTSKRRILTAMTK